MEAKKIIEQVRSAVVQIATPFSTGTGFFLVSEGLIITNEHVVRDNKVVVLDGATFDKQLAAVMYVDPRLDIAFVAAPEAENVTRLELASAADVVEGESVLAVGHPFGLKYTATMGIVSNTQHDQGGTRYLQHDAALNPGNSGGPLLDLQGRIVGINTFIIRDGNSVGFALPSSYLVEAVKEYADHHQKTAVRCHSCGNMVFDDTVQDSYCPVCGTKVSLPSLLDDYEPVGVKRTIEQLLEELGYDVPLSRKGPNNWQIENGSAEINISYHEQTGLIVGDAILAVLPRQDIKPIYEFLLKENYAMSGLTFSVQGQDIMLSLLIYDRYLNVESGKTLFNLLTKRADDYDNILVERFGAQWKARTG